jgi:hypothetical protein
MQNGTSNSFCSYLPSLQIREPNGPETANGTLYSIALTVRAPWGVQLTI